MPEVECFLWNSAIDMIEAAAEHLPGAAVISLDHDLIPESKSIDDPGTGLLVCRYFATLPPVCPVILHTSNEEAAWSMLFTLSNANWETDWIRHNSTNEFWIGELWLPMVRSHIAKG